MPVKTALTALAFVALILLPVVAPALNKYKSLDPRNIASVLDLPLLKMKEETPPEDLHNQRPVLKRPENLIDPTRSLDRFYESLLKGGTTRIVHYGDSPTTADLITGDVRDFGSYFDKTIQGVRILPPSDYLRARSE